MLVCRREAPEEATGAEEEDTHSHQAMAPERALGHPVRGEPHRQTAERERQGENRARQYLNVRQII